MAAAVMEHSDVVTSDLPLSNGSFDFGDQGSRQENKIERNLDLIEERIDSNYIVGFDKNEVDVASEQPENAKFLVDKIVEVTSSEREGSISEDSDNVLKGKGVKQHIAFKGDESEDEEEEVEVEEVELEFENLVPKLHTHNAYCPNCDARITKVVLRRRIPKKILTPSTSAQRPKEEERELVGCLSCFSIFVPKANKLDPFPIFEGGDDIGASSHQLESIPKSTSQEIGCDPFAMFRKKEENGEVPNAKLSQPNKEETRPATQEGNRTSFSGGGQAFTTTRKQGYETLPLPSVNSGEISVSIRDLPGTFNPLVPINEVQSNSMEIVKSIVYGGLAESITSLTVVSSAAASGAATLNIVAMGLANLIAGLFLLVQNLSNLKNDQQEMKYKDALGRKEHFSVHATIAMISYLVFGLIPPIIYGFTFQDTDDHKDFKLLAMIIATLICIVFLAIAKAYVTQAQQLHKFSTYLNFVLYYVATAALVSGVGYVLGDKAKTFLENFGWFHYPKDQAITTSFFHGSQTLLEPSFVSY